MNYTDELTGSVKGLRIGINEDYFFNQVDAGIEKAVRQAITSLEKEGATVEVVKVPALSYSEFAGTANPQTAAAGFRKNVPASRCLN